MLGAWLSLAENPSCQRFGQIHEGLTSQRTASAGLEPQLIDLIECEGEERFPIIDFREWILVVKR